MLKFWKQVIYKFIYSGRVNFILRHINRAVHIILPQSWKISPSGVLSLRLAGAKFKIVTNPTSYVGKDLFWEGPSNFEYTSLFIDLIKKIDCLYDVGANIGYYSIAAASVNSGLQVVSFEPASGPFNYLRRNVIINKLSNVAIEQIALSDKNGYILFSEVVSNKYNFIDNTLSGEGNSGGKMKKLKYKEVNVPTITLDLYAQRVKSQPIDLIKMDTEGTEHLILANATTILTDMKPIIICETLYDTIEAELESVMRPLGYKFFNVLGPGLKEVNTIRRTEDNGVRDCFFVHPDKLKLVEKYLVEV